MANKKLQVKLVRSLNGRIQKQKDTIRGLGLRKINSVSVLEDTPSVRGMIAKVPFLIEVQEVE